MSKIWYVGLLSSLLTIGSTGFALGQNPGQHCVCPNATYQPNTGYAQMSYAPQVRVVGWSNPGQSNRWFSYQPNQVYRKASKQRWEYPKADHRRADVH